MKIKLIILLSICYNICAGQEVLTLDPVISEGSRPSRPQGPSGSAGTDRDRSATTLLKSSIPRVPYVLSQSTKSSLEEIQNEMFRISWIKRLLVGNVILNLISNSFRDIAVEQFNQIKNSDWKAMGEACKNLDQIQHEKIEDEIDNAINKLEWQSADNFAKGYKDDRLNIERKFWNDFKKSFPQYDVTGASYYKNKGRQINYLYLDDKPSASMTFNVFAEGEKGMYIIPHFTARNAQLVDLRVAVFFFFTNGQDLKDTNGKYRTPNGNVTTQRVANGNCKSCSPATDFKLFIPYSELHLVPNQYHKLKFYVQIFGYDNVIGTSEWYYFDIN